MAITPLLRLGWGINDFDLSAPVDVIDLVTRKQLGHRKIETTLICTQLVNFESDDYSSAVAENIDEASRLV